MDALAAILMPGFHESDWRDDEVGIAVGRDVLVIPIRKGLDSSGFIGKYYVFQAGGRSIREVADGLFSVIIENAKTQGRILDCLAEQFLLSGSEADALTKVGLPGRAGLPDSTCFKIRMICSSEYRLPFMKESSWLQMPSYRILSLYLDQFVGSTPQERIYAPFCTLVY